MADPDRFSPTVRCDRCGAERVHQDVREVSDERGLLHLCQVVERSAEGKPQMPCRLQDAWERQLAGLPRSEQLPRWLDAWDGDQ